VRTEAIVATIVMLGSCAGPCNATEPEAGIKLAEKVCAACHGREGRSVSPLFPRLAGQQPAYLENQLKAFRDRSRGDPRARGFMWGMASQLSDDVIKQLAGYYASQVPAPGTPRDPEAVAEGRRIFEAGISARNIPACRSCHGENGEGADSVPRLAGQHKSYLANQLKAFSLDLRDNQIMENNAKHLTEAEIDEVATFLETAPRHLTASCALPECRHALEE
jgi:cytochrome c553